MQKNADLGDPGGGVGKSWGVFCLVGKILLHPVGVFLSYLEAPSSHIVFFCFCKKYGILAPHSYQLMLGLLVQCIYGPKEPW